VSKGRRIDLGGGSAVYRGVTFERRLAVLIGIADRLRASVLRRIVECASQRLFEEWKNEAAEIDDGVQILRAFERATWAPLTAMTQVVARVRDGLVDQAELGCRVDELRELISVIDFDTDEDGTLHRALRSAYREYRRDNFRGDLSECRADEQFAGLLEDLELFKDRLGVDISREVAAVHERMSEYEEEEHKERDYDGEASDLRAQELFREASIREMFGSLASDRD
jgi:hypothetical protein